MAVTCPACGAPNQGGTASCARCGAALTPRPFTSQPTAPAAGPAPAAPGARTTPGPGSAGGAPGVAPAPRPSSPQGIYAPGKTPPDVQPAAGAKRTLDPQPQAANSGGAPVASVQPPARTGPVVPRVGGSAPAGATGTPPAGVQNPTVPIGPLPSAAAAGGDAAGATRAPMDTNAADPQLPEGDAAAGAGWTSNWPDSWQWPYGAQQAYGWPQAYGSPPAGYAGYSPWYPPYPMYGYPSPFMGMYGWPYWMPYFMPPYPYPMMPNPYGFGGQMPYQAAAPYPYEHYPSTPYPSAPMPYTAYPGQQQVSAGAARPKKTRPLYTALVIIVLLMLIGGGVAAAVLLTGSTSASYRLGDSSVTGVDIEFRAMSIRQSGNVLTLSGTYDNNTKYEGEVIVTVQALTSGNEQPITFTVPVVPGTGKSFSQQKSAESLKLSGATLGSLVYTGSTGSSSGTGSSNSSGTSSYPYNQTSPSQSTSPSNSYQYNLDQTSPNSNVP